MAKSSNKPAKPAPASGASRSIPADIAAGRVREPELVTDPPSTSHRPSQATASGRGHSAADLQDSEALFREYFSQARKEIRATHYERAVQLLQQILELPDSGISRADLGLVYYNSAIAYYRLGQYDESLSYYLRALDVHRDLDNKRLISSSLNGIGNVHYAREDYSNALLYYKEGMELDELLEDRHAMGVACNNIGLVYGGLGDMQRAREYLERSMHIREELGDKDGVAYCLNNIGYSWFLDKQPERALTLVQQSLVLREEQGDLYGTVNALTLLAQIHVQLREYPTAIACLQRALPIASENKLQREQLSIFEELAKAYEANAEYAQALQSHREFHKRSREVFNAQSEERMQQLVVKHKLERAQYDKEMYRLKNEQLEMALHRKNDELATMALLLVQKAELLNKFRRRLPEMLESGSKNAPIEDAMEELDHILGLSKEWESFERGLQETHQEFISSLATQFSDLSPTELRLCTLIKLGLNNKDIAGLMNVGVRVIENHRYRMRRKFGLRSQDKLDRYLLEYEKHLRRQVNQKNKQNVKSHTNRNSAQFTERSGSEPDAPAETSAGSALAVNSQAAMHDSAVRQLGVQSLSLRLPELSHMEVKVCSLLLLSMSSKEIADSLSLSVRTIERHRLRIRRKLGLGRQVNLATYLASLG